MSFYFSLVCICVLRCVSWSAVLFYPSSSDRYSDWGVTVLKACEVTSVSKEVNRSNSSVVSTFCFRGGEIKMKSRNHSEDEHLRQDCRVTLCLFWEMCRNVSSHCASKTTSLHTRNIRGVHRNKVGVCKQAIGCKFRPLRFSGSTVYLATWEDTICVQKNNKYKMIAAMNWFVYCPEWSHCSQ